MVVSLYFGGKAMFQMGKMYRLRSPAKRGPVQQLGFNHHIPIWMWEMLRRRLCLEGGKKMSRWRVVTCSFTNKGSLRNFLGTQQGLQCHSHTLRK